MKKIALALAASLLIPFSASAWDRSYNAAHAGKVNFNRTTSIEVLGWQSHIDGDIQVDGTPVDLDSEVGFGSENRFGFRLSHVLSEKSAIELSYMKNDHAGNVNKKITFEKKDYDAGARMRLQNSWFDVAYSHNLTKAKEADKAGRELFYLDGLLGVKFSKAEINVAGQSDPLAGPVVTFNENWDESFPVPYIGLTAGGQIADNLWLKGHVKYLKVNSSGTDATHADYGINAALRLNPKAEGTEWFVDLGYRGVRYDIKSDGDKADLRYTGPTLGLFARF